MDKRSDIFHSKNYLVLNFFLFGYVLLCSNNKCRSRKVIMYVTCNNSTYLIGTKEAYKRNFFEYYKNKNKLKYYYSLYKYLSISLFELY